MKLAGMISKIRNQITKKGDMMRYVELEDLSGTIEVLVFPTLLRKFDSILQPDTIVVMEGNLDVNEDMPTKMRLEAVSLLSDADRQADNRKLYLQLSSDEKKKEEKIKNILKANPGNVPVLLYYRDKKETMSAPSSLWVSLNDKIVEDLKALIGAENVKVVEKK